MKYAILSDVHANEIALCAVLRDAEREGVNQIVCLGDIVGYGSSPAKALALIRRNANVVLAGNHDDAVSGRQGAEDFIELAGESIDRHRAALSNADKSYLRSLPYECAFEGAIATHGDFTDAKKFYYIENEEDAAANFKATDAHLMFVGHTHVPTIFTCKDPSGSIVGVQAPPSDSQPLVLDPSTRYIVNPGSIGYPREADGKCLSSYVIYDSEKQTIAYRWIPFSIASVMQRGRQRRSRKIAYAAAAVCAAILIGALLVRTARPVRTAVYTKEVTVREDRALVIDRKSLTLAPNDRFVRANLKLDKSGDAAELWIVFKSANGEILDEKNWSVKQSARQSVKVPVNAVSAHFTVCRQNPTAQPRIISFKPGKASR